MNSLRISNLSGASQRKIRERRTSSYDFSTCDSRRTRSVKEFLKVLPRPTSIHDYIDDVIEIARDTFDIGYFKS